MSSGIIKDANYNACYGYKFNFEASKCQFKYPKVSIGLGGGIALGTLIGLGIAGIIYLLTKKDKEE